jgi:hypothetical protein
MAWLEEPTGNAAGAAGLAGLAGLASCEEPALHPAMANTSVKAAVTITASRPARLHFQQAMLIAEI